MSETGLTASNGLAILPAVAQHAVHSTSLVHTQSVAAGLCTTLCTTCCCLRKRAATDTMECCWYLKLVVDVAPSWALQRVDAAYAHSVLQACLSCVEVEPCCFGSPALPQGDLHLIFLEGHTMVSC